VGAEVDSIFKIIMINIIRSSHTLVLGLNGFESLMSASEVNVLRNAMRFCLFSTLSLSESGVLEKKQEWYD